MKYFKHPTAIIDDSVNIGEDAKIWHFTHISKNVKIGNRVIIGQNVFVGEDVIIGNGCKIQNNVSIFKGVILENDVFISPSVVFTNVKKPRAFIEQKNNFKKTLVRKGATIGANSTIISGLTIGEYSMIGAGSLVTKNIKSYKLAIGSPCREVYNINEKGEKI